MTPKTKFGNRLGPGWANYFWFVAPGQTPVKPVDNLNGTYTATISFTGNIQTPVTVHFLGGAGAVIPDTTTGSTLPVPLGGNNTVGDVPGVSGSAGKFAVFLDLGANFPQGMFSTAFKNGFSLNAGLEYMATSHFSVEGIFGYHYAPAKVAGSINIYQFSVDGKGYLLTGNIRPFINAGIGGYAFSPGSTKFGGNVGGGVLFTLSSRWGLQGSYNFHVVSTPISATRFSTLQGGVRYVF
jgi:hypothetical protein